ncbi:hypothetical protein ACA910_007497 [Epithemia clementina (nom. ined.)]
MFHLVSVTVEELSNAVVPRMTSVEENNEQSSSKADNAAVGSAVGANIGDVGERLDLSLELYAMLLGHLLQEGGDKALDAVEHTTSPQRVCSK